MRFAAKRKKGTDNNKNELNEIYVRSINAKKETSGVMKMTGIVASPNAKETGTRKNTSNKKVPNNNPAILKGFIA